VERDRVGSVSARAACALAGALLLAACSSHELYYWGDYEGSVGRVGGRDEGFDVVAEIDTLETDLEQAQNSDRPVPPGFHAHLGYLHYLNGNLAGAVNQLEAEKQRFPESAVFVDALLARIAPPPTPAP